MDIESQIRAREQARSIKDYHTADAIRDQLKSRGVLIYDNDNKWKASDGRDGMLR